MKEPDAAGDPGGVGSIFGKQNARGTPSTAEPLLVTAGVVVFRGRVLLTRRAKGDLAGFWEFPGGKVEPGESEEACLRRELLEELGLAVCVQRFLGENRHEYPRLTVRLRAWLCRCTDADAQRILLTDHDAFAWVNNCQLPAYPFAPADVPFLPQVDALLGAEPGTSQ